jgi:hypothetical protein
MTRRYVLLAAASIALLAACSGSDGQARVTVTTPVTAITSAPDTTQPEPSPAPTPATIETVANTGTAPAPATTTRPTPTTTLDPIAEIEAAVQQARLDLEDAYTASIAEPAAPELRAVYQGFYTEEAFVPREEFLDDMISDGTSGRPSTVVPKTITFPGHFELVNDQTAILRVCRVDSDVLRLTPENGSPEIIVDDRVVATLTDSRFELVDGRWLLAGGDRIRRIQDSNSCDG